MKEIGAALQEMIKLHATTPALLQGERESVFREIFIFYYPDFHEQLQELLPDLTHDEELFCMLTSLRQKPKDITQLLCWEMVYIDSLHAAVCEKAGLPAKELGKRLKKCLSLRKKKGGASARRPKKPGNGDA